MNLDRKVKIEMARQRMTLRDLARAVGEVRDEYVSVQRVEAMVKSGNPQAKTLGYLAEALRVNVEYFFED